MENDVKKWIVACEEGRGGYKHYQIRLKTSNPDFYGIEEKKVPVGFKEGRIVYEKKKYKVGWLAENIPEAHCEEAQDLWNYERKEHHYVSSEDTREILNIRYGHLRTNQEKILERLNEQSDREVTVVFDQLGNHGKSWMAIHLYETGRAMVVPRASTTAEKLSAYVCSAYAGEPIIIIDIPRSRKITGELYEAIEELKDGLVFDHRYSGHCRNIRGVKVLVTTNEKMDINALSKDRWKIIDTNGEQLPLSAIAQANAQKRTSKKK